MIQSNTLFRIAFVSWSMVSGAAFAQFSPDAAPNIVGGEIVNDLNSLEYKHTVRLLVSAKLGGVQVPPEMQGLKMTWRCSGALLTPAVVLSAAHCFPKTLAVTLPDSGRVVRGELLGLSAEAYFKKDSRSDSPWGVRADRIIVHESFREDWVSAVSDPWNPLEPIADLAILSLSGKASSDKAGVALLKADDQPVSEGEKVILAGYGRDVTDGQISIPRLRRVEVPFRQALRNLTEWFVGRGDLTRAGKVESPQGACMGDSGGPVFVLRDGQTKLAGIIIRGPSAENGGCEASVTIVTAIPAYDDWIDTQMGRLAATATQK